MCTFAIDQQYKIIKYEFKLVIIFEGGKISKIVLQMQFIVYGLYFKWADKINYPIINREYCWRLEILKKRTKKERREQLPNQE